jgi:hypothetical protein
MMRRLSFEMHAARTTSLGDNLGDERKAFPDKNLKNNTFL